MKGLALFASTLLLLASVALLFFSCIHWRPAGWFCMFVVPVLLVAFFAPAPCYGYKKRLEIDLMQTAMSREGLDACRQFGYSVAVTLALFAYAIPVLVWYNSESFTVGGVLVMDACITCVMVAFALWIRVFVY